MRCRLDEADRRLLHPAWWSWPVEVAGARVREPMSGDVDVVEAIVRLHELPRSGRVS